MHQADWSSTSDYRRYSVHTLSGISSTLTEVFHNFHQSCQANQCWERILFRPWSLSCNSLFHIWLQIDTNYYITRTKVKNLKNTVRVHIQVQLVPVFFKHISQKICWNRNGRNWARKFCVMLLKKPAFYLHKATTASQCNSYENKISVSFRPFPYSQAHIFSTLELLLYLR
jgi:hypothetical protein